MNTRQLFNLVAPIAIFHGTDVCFKEKAVKAIQVLFESKEDLVRMTFGFKGKYEDWQDYLEHERPANLPSILELYGNLFHEIMEDNMDGVKKSHDRWGAVQYHDRNDQFIFAGDACSAYPWFDTWELLEERLHEHAVAQE